MNKREMRTIAEMKKKLKHNHADLINAARINYALRFGASILWYIFIYISLSQFYDAGKKNMIYTVLYCTVVLIAVIVPTIYIFKIHQIFFDSTWTGTVTQIILTTNLISKTIIIYREEVYITHEYNDKKIWKMRIRKCNGDYNPIGYYKQSDEVIHYKGLNFCEKLDKRKDSCVICLYCGQLNLPANSKCRKCRRSIVK